jgi:iron complex transport system permease protein
MLVGGGLALTGATLQGIFRNPLVSAHILGVSSGAAFGGVLALLLAASTVLFVTSAMLFGLLAMLVVYVMSRVGGRTPVLMLVLSGVITGAFFSAGVSILTYLADPYDALPALVFWLMGSLAAASYDKVVVIGLPVLVGGGLLLLNVLSLGDEEAEALGLQVEPLRWLCLVATAAIVAGAVAVSGVIGWVGLVIPHIARMLVGPDHRVLLPASFMLGGVYLMVMDSLARSLSAAEIPLGILTALIGAPVFFYLLRRSHGRGWVGD